ncbi:MAG: cytochrome c [Roseitalea sp.]|jgi:mono/diheme cytochrome c family protein|nr:cytochrome c [Roseitalea sp.]MBO6720718.1 cytochrome c [Roseitalea sp.]MBO6743865.1 cytochrome c [Roseitalea sp.]
MIWRITILVTLAAVVIAVVYWRLADGGQPPSGEALADVFVPPLSANGTEGEALFNASCASCHGTAAAGRNGVAPPLVHIIYEPNHHADAAFVLAIRNGVRAHHWRFGNMPPVEGLSDEQIAKITTYIRELQRANGIQ